MQSPPNCPSARSGDQRNDRIDFADFAHRHFAEQQAAATQEML
jgi:hypothetical protein